MDDVCYELDNLRLRLNFLIDGLDMKINHDQNSLPYKDGEALKLNLESIADGMKQVCDQIEV